MDGKADRREKVQNEIRKFADNYLKEPFNYLNEADVQSILFCRIRDILKEEKVTMAGEHQHKYGKIDSITINTVHREYPREYSKEGQFDIAIIDKENHNSEPKLKNDNFWYQPVEIAIEIKLTGPHIDNMFDDIDKISKYRRQNKGNKLNDHDPKTSGIVLQFIHPYLWGDKIQESKNYKGYKIEEIGLDGIIIEENKVVGYIIGITKGDTENKVSPKRSYFKVASNSAS
jgi:hypothetical protein